MRITRIEAQKRRPGRKSIFLDGAFAIGISDETLLRSGLRTGDSLEPEALKELQDLEEVSDARTSALRLLGRRPRSTKELTDRLRRKQYREETINTVILKLTETGILDDEAFARMYLRDHLTLRPSGGRLLAQKLRRFGIDREMIVRVLADALPDETDAAIQAAEKYLRSRSTGLEESVVRSRLTAFLARRGFSWETINATIEKVL